MMSLQCILSWVQLGFSVTDLLAINTNPADPNDNALATLVNSTMVILQQDQWEVISEAFPVISDILRNALEVVSFPRQKIDVCL